MATNVDLSTLKRNDSPKLIQPYPLLVPKINFSIFFSEMRCGEHLIEIDTEQMVTMAIWTMSAHFSMSGKKAKYL